MISLLSCNFPGEFWEKWFGFSGWIERSSGGTLGIGSQHATGLSATAYYQNINKYFEGFMLCSVIKFKEPLRLLLNQERVTQINTDVGISDTSTAILVHVKAIFYQAVP